MTRPGRGLQGIGLAILALLAAGQAGAAQPELDLRSLEVEVSKRVNEYRKSVGKPLFESNAEVAAVARRHSEEMASGRAGFGHDGLKDRAAELGRSIEMAGLAENVSKHDRKKGFVDAAIQNWLASPPHKKNLDGDYDLAGVGAARSPDGVVYVTQIFVKRR